MRQALFISLAALGVAAIQDPARLAASVNSVQGSWTASASSPLATMTHQQIQHSLVGVRRDIPNPYRPSLEMKRYTEEERRAAPEEFDARKQWPSCKSMSQIRDQAWCGSCWAFGAVESMSDRHCIAAGHDIILSAEDMNSCSGAGSCNGGWPEAAYSYWVKQGVVTDDCRTYSIPGCDHHIPNSTNPCPSGYGPTPECKKTCIDGTAWEDAKHKGAKMYGIEGEQDLMVELSTNGPCEAVIDVYEDFLLYTKGIYHHVSGSFEGGHAIRILGYGVENGEKYWLLANSWNEHWGENGFFRMRRGNDECGVESEITCGIPL